MSKNVGCMGWGVAGLLLVGLISQCGEDPVDPSASSAIEQASASVNTRVLYVRPERANCRADPTPASATVTAFSRNRLLVLSEERAGWSRVSDDACWIRSDLLSEDRVPEPAPVQRMYGGGGGSSAASTRRASSSVYYRNCSAARAAGAAPVYAGDPGYARRLDRDGDGIGCE